MKAKLTESVLTGSDIRAQIELETRSVREGALRYRKLVRQTVERGDGPALKAVERIMLRWFPPLRRSIAVDQGNIRRKQYDQGGHIWGPPMVMLDSSRLSVIVMHETLSRCIQTPSGVPVVKLSYAIGRAVIAEECLRIMRGSYRDQLAELDRRCKAYSPKNVNWWANKTLNEPLWNRRVCTHVGTRLLWHLIQNADCSRDEEKEFRLAFHHRRKRINRKTPAFIVPDDQLLEIIEEGHRFRQSLRPRYAPMIVRPFAWTDKTEGGYARIRTPLVSRVTPTQRAALESSNLGTVFDCLNAVNSTPWRINHRVLAVVEALWQRGGCVSSIPSANPIPLPPRAPSDSDEREIRRAKADRCRVYEKNVHLRADREVFVQKLNMATSMAGNKMIYFPHQLDFRSRFYPIPQPFNHQGDDVCRALLEFAEPREPDSRGERWLRVHAANCYGIDKVPFESRVAWTDTHAVEIERACRDPLNNEWWMAADKPLQFLAACYALTDPRSGARLPVQRDGTCNGLQHYAALGRDADGARSVNMYPDDHPSDIYQEVADEVARLVADDAAHGRGTLRYHKDRRVVEKSIRMIAKRLDGRISRKLVKPHVMTTVYGVTLAGMRRQAKEQLIELGIISEKDSTALLETKLYLTDQTTIALGRVCSGARAIMEWIGSVAREVASEGHPVAWSTPVGFPVVQPYRKWKMYRVHTIIGTITLQVDEVDVPVHLRDQVRGAAPNFIHALDASHALSVALACHRKGIHAAFVHDSYWTHAATTDAIDRILREGFVRLHNADLLGMFHAEQQRKCSSPLPPPPDRGDYDIQNVLKSPYFFS